MTPALAQPTLATPILATHGGKFHCDEVFAYVVLCLALGLDAPGRDHTLLRTRRPEPIESAAIVWDVGSVYDAAANRFDHHQRGAPLRPDGTPFSSAGLVWQVYGERAAAALLRPSNEGFAAAVAAELDASVVRRIDEIDNGVSARGPVTHDALSLSALVGDFNPSWDDPAANGLDAGDAAFLQAAALVRGVLQRQAEGLRARMAAEAAVLAAHRAAEDPPHPRARPGHAVEERGLLPGLARAVRRLAGLQRQLDAGHGAARAWLLRATPAAARGVGRVCRGWSWRRRAAWRTRCSCMCAASWARRSHGPGRWHWRARRWSCKLSGPAHAAVSIGLGRCSDLRRAERVQARRGLRHVRTGCRGLAACLLAGDAARLRMDVMEEREQHIAVPPRHRSHLMQQG